MAKFENKSESVTRDSASFRDPSGFIFWKNGVLYRQINKVFKTNYDFLMSSGLYKELRERGYIIPHEEADIGEGDVEAYKIIRPEIVRFISYPYEWCFSELKDAALLTLKIQRIAMQFGMSLRDASAYNIQFHKGRPVLIDTLSFEKYNGGPWAAYGQFCRHFLAPLALAGYRDPRLLKLGEAHIDGIPLDLTSTLLPWRTHLNPGIFFHIHMHAKSEKRFSEKKISGGSRELKPDALAGILGSLENAIRSQKLKASSRETPDRAGYKETVLAFLQKATPVTVIDLNAEKHISRLLSEKGICTIACNKDHAAVEENYAEAVTSGEKNVLPLVLDLVNPSPALGWANKERTSFTERGPVDMVIAIDALHHLAISNNTPLKEIASFLSELGKSLIIEFIPKNDARVERLLENRPDVFLKYTKEEFERVFGSYFRILEAREMPGSQGTLYLMEK